MLYYAYDPVHLTQAKSPLIWKELFPEEDQDFKSYNISTKSCVNRRVTLLPCPTHTHTPKIYLKIVYSHLNFKHSHVCNLSHFSS